MAHRGVDRPPYATACRLYFLAEDRWAEIYANYINVDLFDLPPHGFLNCVYTWAVERIPPDKLEQWQHELWKPVPGRQATEVEVEQEGQLFMELLAKEGGK